MRVRGGKNGLIANFAGVIERHGSRHFQITYHYNIVDFRILDCLSKSCIAH